MKLTTKFFTATALAALAACGGNNAANNAAENATEVNTMTETTTVNETNMSGETNATGNVELNSAGTNTYGNATSNNAM
jgi:hypothetical protein